MVQSSFDGADLVIIIKRHLNPNTGQKYAVIKRKSSNVFFDYKAGILTALSIRNQTIIYWR